MVVPASRPSRVAGEAGVPQAHPGLLLPGPEAAQLVPGGNRVGGELSAQPPLHAQRPEGAAEEAQGLEEGAPRPLAAGHGFGADRGLPPLAKGGDRRLQQGPPEATAPGVPADGEHLDERRGPGRGAHHKARGLLPAAGEEAGLRVEAAFLQDLAAAVEAGFEILRGVRQKSLEPGGGGAALGQRVEPPRRLHQKSRVTGTGRPASIDSAMAQQTARERAPSTASTAVGSPDSTQSRR